MIDNLRILDGGMGHELRRLGAPFSRPLWSAETLIKAPKYVHRVHKAFIDSGAEIITVNSYACVPFHLGDELFNNQGAALAQQAAAIAREAADQAGQEVLVAGNIPPVLGSYRPDWFDARRARPILKTLIDAQELLVDIWLAETLSTLEEFETVDALLSESDKPRFYAFTLDDDSDSPLLRSGESVESVAKRLCASTASALLFNCSIPEKMSPAIEIAKRIIDEEQSALKIGVYANKFTPIRRSQDSSSEDIEMREITPSEYLDYAKEWHRLGADIIGGCCGIGPEYIEQLSNWKLS